MDPTIILFCDDDPMRAVRMHDWQTKEDRERTIWVKNVKEAIRVLKDYGESIEAFHLDHDLDGQEELPTNSCLAGMEIIRWFENLPPHKRARFVNLHITLHDHNRRAAMDQFKRLKALNIKVTYTPFGLETVLK